MEKLSRRRQFLALVGYTALSLQLLPLTEEAAASEAAADSLAVTSSLDSKLGRWAAHSHVLYVPLQSFRAPPREGITLSTTWTFLHFHEVTLSREQLVTVARGGAVQVPGGAHTFSIALG